MVKLAKWTLIALVLFAVSIVVLIEGVYYKELYALDISKPEISSTFSDEYHKALWVLFEESGEVKLKPIMATEYVVALLKSSMSDDLIEMRKVFPSGERVAAMIGRKIIWANTNVKGRGHLPRIVASIWVLNNFSTKEALDYLLSNIYLGNGVSGVKAAATYYYRKSPSELTNSEIVTLITMSRSPTWYSPYCNSAKLEKHARDLYKKVGELWDKQFPINGYVYPVFVSVEERKCK